jgi:hypothetical protein
MEPTSIEFNKRNSKIQIIEDTVEDNKIWLLVEVKDMKKDETPSRYISSNFYDWFGDGIHPKDGDKKINKSGAFDPEGTMFVLINSWY